MANYAPGDGYPFLHQIISEEIPSRPILDSRISSVSDLGSPTLSFSNPYDPQPHTSDSGDFVSPQSSFGDLHSGRNYSPLHDAIDLSHVQISPWQAESVNQQQNPPVPSTRALRSLQRGAQDSPPTVSNRSRFSWRQTDHYESLPPADASHRANRGFTGRLRSATKRLSRQHPIPEGDEMDMGLINNANAFDLRGVSHSTHEVFNEQEEGVGTLGVDISTFTGPMHPQDEATLLEYRRLEARGQLTGGLGVGLKPDVRITSRDLYASAYPTSSPRISRVISRRGTKLGRAPTLRDIGQREANRSGKVIEVVVDDGIDKSDQADQSLYDAGGDIPVEFDPLKNRQPTGNFQKAITYYPQANWKPVSMKLPYLMALVVVSIALAAAQEVLYQKSSYLANLEPPSGLFQFHNAQELSAWDYFSLKYLPTIIAVTYGVLWQVTDYEVKRLEPYYHLSKEGGALAAESINVDYITVLNLLRPFMALRYGHYAVALSSIATILAVSLVPIFQTASMVLQPDRDTRFKDPLGMKIINIDPIFSRVLTGVLGVISILGLMLLILLQRRRSGLAGDVKGIAGIAALATKSHVLMDFKDLDTVPPQDIHNKLKNHRYILQNSSLAPDDAVPLTREDKDKYDQYHLTANPHPLMLRLIAGVPFIISIFAFSIFIPVVLFTRADIVLDKTPWVLTALAVGIKIGFQTLEQDARMMEPFYRLSCRHAPPKVLTLDYTSMAFGYMPIRASLNGDYLIALVGFGSILAEILTVCVTSFAGVNAGLNSSNDNPINSSAETLLSLRISFSLSLGILLYLIVIAFFVYKRRRHPFLPRQPSTIASVLAFIHQSKMLYDFVAVPAPRDPSDLRPPLPETSPSSSSIPNPPSRVGTSTSAKLPTPITSGLEPTVLHKSKSTRGAKDEQDLLVERLTRMGKTYGLGWFTGRDGETHCGVDEEELEGSYRHRAEEDARKANKPWLGNWEHY